MSKIDTSQDISERHYRGATTEHRAPGIELGLFDARGVITMLGSPLGFESDRDAGTTTFHVTLPSEAGCK